MSLLVWSCEGEAQGPEGDGCKTLAVEEAAEEDEEKEEEEERGLGRRGEGPEPPAPACRLLFWSSLLDAGETGNNLHGEKKLKPEQKHVLKSKRFSHVRVQ